jgi:hypothetical protein
MSRTLGIALLVGGLAVAGLGCRSEPTPVPRTANEVPCDLRLDTYRLCLAGTEGVTTLTSSTTGVPPTEKEIRRHQKEGLPLVRVATAPPPPAFTGPRPVPRERPPTRIHGPGRN